MHRNVTAIYRSREVAELVRRGLEDIGVPAANIHVIPDAADDPGSTVGAGAPGGRIAGTGTGVAAPAGTAASANSIAGPTHPLQGAGYLTEPAHTDRLHELHLPEEDLRTYQQCVRRGDYVVSAEVDDPQVEKVKAVMRRPETEVYDIEHRASEFRSESLIPHSAGEGHMLNEEMRARRLALGDDDRFARTYERDRRLEGRMR